MVEKLKVYLRFENLVADIFRANQFNVTDHNILAPDRGYDFLAQKGDSTYAVEVKYYRTARPQISLIEGAANRFLAVIETSNLNRGMLVLGCDLTPELRRSMEEKYGLLIIDRGNLLLWASETPRLVDELSTLLEERSVDLISDDKRSVSDSVQSNLAPKPAPQQDHEGTQLCQELARTPKGKDHWQTYEQLCTRVLKYIFPKDLHGWHEQNRTDDGLNRFDYVCRILPATEFWSFLIDHLNSRYVLFEFKNYSEKIKQGQILTTEKYLLEKGLRRVAIVFTRDGAGESAIKMSQGAMREHGKLILVLDDEKVSNMLQMKERGEDPTDLLFELADEFLLSLPR